jgi:hypothetical protein
MNKIPPRLTHRFLNWFCPPSLYEGIEGDLLEQYEEDVKLVGEKKAKKRLMWNDFGVLSFLIPGAIALLIAILTVASQSIKAAMADPVNSLKNE